MVSVNRHYFPEFHKELFHITAWSLVAREGALQGRLGDKQKLFRTNSWLASSPLTLGLFDVEFREHDQGLFPSVMVINGSIVR